LMDLPGHKIGNTFCAAIAYDRAGKDAECLGWNTLEFLCRTRAIDLLQDCHTLEDQSYPILMKTAKLRDQNLQYNYKRVGELVEILRKTRENIPQVVWDRRPNAVTDIFD
jgi:hypothetical protein